MKTAVAEARDGRRGRRPGRRRDRRARPVERRASSASWPPAWPRTAAARRSSGPTSATSSGRRAGATARSTSARRSSSAATCSSASAAMPARPASRSRPSAGTSSASRFLALAADRAPRDPRVAARGRPGAARAPTSTTRLHRELAALAPCGPGNPDPLVAVLGLTVTRVRAATGGHSQLTLRRERDVLDGIAFGRAGHRRDRPRGRPARRRRPPDEPGVRRLRVAPARHPRRRDGGRTTTDPRSATGDARRPPAPRRERLVTTPRRRRPLGSAGRWLAPVLSIVGLLIVAFVTLSLLEQQRAVRRRLEAATATATATATARPTPRRRRRTSSSCRRRSRSQGPGLDRLRQGRQHLGPDRQGRQAADDRRQRLDAVLVAGRQVDLLHPDDRRRSATGSPGNVLRDYQMTDPERHAASRPTAARTRSRLINGTGHHQRPAPGTSWIREPVVSPDGQTMAMVSDRPNPSTQRRRPPVLRPRRPRSRRSRSSPRRRRSATRTRPGDRTARRCCTSATAATGAKGAPVIYRWDVAKKKAHAADRPGLPRAVVLAGRPVHRRDQAEQLRQRPRHPRRGERPRAPAADHRRRVVGAGLVAGRRLDRVPPHPTARSSTSS